MLFYSGYTHRLGDVDEGTTVTNWWTGARPRHHHQVRGHHNHLAQHRSWRRGTHQHHPAPGHMDFTAEVQRSLRVLDGGIVIFDAVNGVEPQSETVWRQADSYRVPRICFINKMDRVGADLDRTVTMIRTRLKAHPVLLQLPIEEETATGSGTFCGVIDLLTMQALRFTEESATHPQLSQSLKYSWSGQTGHTMNWSSGLQNATNVNPAISEWCAD